MRGEKASVKCPQHEGNETVYVHLLARVYNNRTFVSNLCSKAFTGLPERRIKSTRIRSLPFWLTYVTFTLVALL